MGRKIMLLNDRKSRLICRKYIILVGFAAVLFFAISILPNASAQEPNPPTPQMESINPENCSVMTGIVDFIYDFDDLEDDVQSLEIDILGPFPYNFPISKIQLNFAADEVDPLYGVNSSKRALLENMSISVSYDEGNEKWTVTIDTTKLWGVTNPWGQPIGSSVWPAGVYDFYVEVEDAGSNQWGNTITLQTYSHYVYSFHEIQPLIDLTSGGETITVLDGGYMENIIINTPSIALEGIGFPVIDGNGSTAIYVDADDVTIDGFEVIRARDSDGSEMGIYYDGVSGGAILNNYIYQNNHGIFIEDSDNVTIAGNSIYQHVIPSVHTSYADCMLGGTGISVWTTVGGTGNYNHLIDNNQIYNNHRQGIYLGANNREGDDSSITKFNIISNNLIYNNGIAWAICSGFPAGSGDEFGIHLKAADENKVGPGNKLYNHDKWSFGSGIYLELSQQNSIISNMYVVGINLSCTGGIFDNSIGIVLFDDSTDNEIVSNDLENNEYGVRVYDGSSTTDSGPGTKINFNNIVGNSQYGLAYGLGGVPSVIINATHNWWNNYTGPYNPTSNPGSNGDTVSDDVDFSDYLSYEWFNLVWVDNYYDPSTPGWGVTHFATINDGINAVFDTGAVEVKPGTYEELVIIDKPLTMKATYGSVATVITDVGATYSEMEQTDGQTVKIACSNVVIDGFNILRYEYTSFHPDAAIGNIGAPGISDVTISDCHIESQYTCSYFSDINDLTFDSNSFDAQPDDIIVVIDETTGFLINNNTLLDYNLIGIRLNNSRDGILNNVVINQKSYQGLIIDHSQNISINGSVFDYNYETAAIINDSSNIVISDSFFKDCLYGICLDKNSTVNLNDNSFSNTNYEIYGAAYLQNHDLYYGEIQDAIDDAGIGWDVFVYPGTFSENLVINKKISVRGLLDVSDTIVNGNDSSPTIYIARDNDVSDITIEGLTIKGGNNCVKTGIYRDVSGLSIKYCIIENPEVGDAVYIDPHHYSDVPPIRNGTDIFSDPVTLQGNMIRGGVYYQFWSHELYGVDINTQLYLRYNDIDVMFLNGSISADIEDNDFYSLGMEYASDVLIERNVFENPWEERYGIYLWSVNGTPPVKDVEIKHNTILGYSSFAVDSGISGQGIVLAGAMDVTIANNEITANSDGIWITEDFVNRNDDRCVGDVYDITISRNDIENGQTGIKLLSNVNATAITGNNIQINGKGIWVHGSNDHIVANNSIIGNYYGIRLDDGSSDNLIYNNYFADNFVHAFDHFSTTNRWNVTLTAGANIMGGPYIGWGLHWGYRPAL